MSKVVCDICGTTYQDSADACPICGCSRDIGGVILTEEPEQAAAAPQTPPSKKGGLFGGIADRKRGAIGASKPSFEDEEDEDDYDYDEDEEEEEEIVPASRGSKALIVLLVLVIGILLMTTAFIFFRYFLPNMQPGQDQQAPVETTSQLQTVPQDTTVPTVPCESLSVSGGNAELSFEGQNWLLNVLVLPENTTDDLIYTSADETVAVVTQDGRVTAVGEGETVILVTCGSEQLEVQIVCCFSADETEEITEPAESTEPTVETTEPLKDITLKVLRWTDLTFNAPNQGFTFVLDGLRNDEVQWSSSDESIVTVDENGFVTSIGRGKATITCQYGDQKVEISINCRW